MRHLVLSLLLLVVLVPNWARAQTPDTVWLEDLTWTEIRDLVQGGTTTIIIPVGGIEQTGPDVAVGKHDARVKVLAETIARALGHTLVAPVVSYVPEGATSPPTSHMRFPGTITIPADAFRKTIASAATSFEVHGFKAVVLIGDHGGYQGDLAAVAAELNRKWPATAARAFYVPDYYRAATSEFYDVLKRHGYSAAEIGTHAGVADTSLSLAIAPKSVRQSSLKTDTGLDAEHGVYGDPRRSNAEMGRLGEEMIVQKTVAAIKADLGRPVK